MLTDQQCIEIFHLVFLRVLKNHMDSALYAIKGGCNLRFFFGSIRYSEDIDFDINIISQMTLKRKIDAILSGTSLQQGLAQYQISIADISAPKQTETVQRWKVSIKHADKIRSFPAKIEFSRRNLDENRKAEPIHHAVLQEYRLQPMILSHYLYATAVKQKIQALVGRNETQARDVFDLHHLFSRKEVPLQYTFDLQKAIDCILSISFNDYHSQVVAYLMAEYAEYYGNQKAWEDMQISVIDYLSDIARQNNETH